MIAVRRRMLAAGAGVVVLALALAAAAVVAAVGDRFNARIDVTTTGEQRLAARTMAVLERAAPLGEVEIVVAVNAASLEPWSRRTVRDVLDLFEHAGAVRASEIDVGSSEGQAEYGRLLDRLIERERAGIDEHIAAVGAAAGEAAAAGDRLEQQIAPALVSLRDALADGDARSEAARAGLEEWAALARLSARRLGEAAGAAQAALTEPDPVLPIPPLAQHEATLRRALDERATELESLTRELEALAASGLGAAGLEQSSGALARAVQDLRDRLARASDALARLPRLDVLRVAEALGSAEIALVIGPPGAGVAGIDIGMLYEPRVVASDGSRLVGDVRFQAEELFASAVSTVLATTNPVVVLTHAEAASVLESTALFNGIRERLARRGIDVVEWSTLREDAPDLREVNPDGVRPVVYVTLSPDSSAAPRTAEEAPGPERAAGLGRALQRLVDEGEPIMLNLNPSVLPAYGERDPVAAPFAALGLELRTGSPLLKRMPGLRGDEVLTELALTGREGEHPIQRAAANLPTLLPWAIPVRAADGSSLRTTALLEVRAEETVWGETQWLRLWQTPRAQRPMIPDKPSFDRGVDDGAGPWTVALAAERADAPAGSRRGRLVVVGSNGWYSDPAAFQYEMADGRVSLASPGNAELFEAAVLWLAGQDELIAQSAGARAMPLVGPIEPARLSIIRWGLVAGLPVLTLLLGALWRAVRG